jgi:hypothetical protein
MAVIIIGKVNKKMKRKLLELNEYQAQIITAIIGAAIMVLVQVVPALVPYQDVLLEIDLIIAGLIIGQSVQKANR